MRFRDVLRQRRRKADVSVTKGQDFSVRVDSLGVSFLADPVRLQELLNPDSVNAVSEQLVILCMLEEEGHAQAVSNGFTMATEAITRLDEDNAVALGLPRLLPETFDTRIVGHTNTQRFSMTVGVLINGVEERFTRTGPIVDLASGARYRISYPTLLMMQAIEDHSALGFDERTETENVTLVARLQHAREIAAIDGRIFEMPLRHLEKFSTVVPQRVGVNVAIEESGEILLTPDLGSLGTADDSSALNSRWHQISDDAATGVIRVESSLVLLEEAAMRGVREVRSHRRIPADRAKEFLRAPGDFLNPEIVDVDIKFGLRVKGIGALAPVTFSEASDSGIEWFDEVTEVLPPSVLAELPSNQDELEDLEEQVEGAYERNEVNMPFDENIIDISDHEEVSRQLDRARRRILDALPKPIIEDAVKVGVIVEESDSTASRLRRKANESSLLQPVDYDCLPRTPFPHQREGIEWMAKLMHASLLEPYESPERLQGAILADDMGLGKTFMALVALKEFLQAQQQLLGEVLPTLVVLPLTLIENWEEEIEKSFSTVPFKDVVVLLGSRDLPRFRLYGSGRETRASASSLDSSGMVREDELNISLRIGPGFGDKRLDMPGRLVLTTYETLTSFQLSLGQIDWGAVFLDEAQTTKNPDALKTRAAKGLRSRFKLLATGTPVENSLKDLWCLMDTAQPGLLGTWQEFRSVWVRNVDTSNHDAKVAKGRELSEFIGPFMLRRNKEDHLTNLPSKTIYSGMEDPTGAVQYRSDLSVQMPAKQQHTYDQHLAKYKLQAGRQKGAALAAISALKAISLHPDSSGENEMESSGALLTDSARMIAMISILDAVQQADEKAIIFVINKKVQRQLSFWLQTRFGIRVRVVNGETKAVSISGNETRRTIIKEFEAKPGFNLIIMSPLAVGTGLTVVGANHAIHLERHWNPAKEAQATDRIYRIGQTRPVHVYLPLAVHPDFPSFDINLDQLLRQKTSLKDAVVVPEVVTNEEMFASLSQS